MAQRDLSIMKKDYPNDHAGQLSKVLSLYLKQTVYPSWVQVATALWNIGEKKMAKDIADKYGMVFLMELCVHCSYMNYILTSVPLYFIKESVDSL